MTKLYTTDGEWRVFVLPNHEIHILAWPDSSRSNAVSVAVVQHGKVAEPFLCPEHRSAEAVANANMLAASKDLYDALLDIVENWDRVELRDLLLQAARRAIRKAE